MPEQLDQVDQEYARSIAVNCRAPPCHTIVCASYETTPIKRKEEYS